MDLIPVSSSRPSSTFIFHSEISRHVHISLYRPGSSDHRIVEVNHMSHCDAPASSIRMVSIFPESPTLMVGNMDGPSVRAQRPTWVMKERAKILNGVNAKTSGAKRSDDCCFVPDLKRCLDDCCTVVSAARFTPEYAYAYKAHCRPKKAICQNISRRSPGIQDFGNAYE